MSDPQPIQPVYVDGLVKLDNLAQMACDIVVAYNQRILEAYRAAQGKVFTDGKLPDSLSESERDLYALSVERIHAALVRESESSDEARAKKRAARLRAAERIWALGSSAAGCATTAQIETIFLEEGVQ